MQDSNAKQQIIERIRSGTNILVTVSANPSVDELSAALGFSLMLNKMDKHATAVFSGATPPAISFLQPEKTFEHSVDSLRDFIIALDKEKADRLRYKVENDVVRIFITPYRTTITDKDLQFSQGDFNVDSIIALGAKRREDLDTAITAHGRILHDATVVTINAGNETSDLGSLDWHDANASSLCEMLMSLSEALQPGLLDEQISTALLTGIVAATDRFSNMHTTPRVMTMAAQLMAAGANQQLIATKLEAEGHIKQRNTDGSTDLAEGESSKVKKADDSSSAPKSKNGELHVHHDADHADANHLPAPVAYGQGPAPKSAEDYERELEASMAPPSSQGSVSTANLASQLHEELTGQAPAEPTPPPVKKPARKPSWLSDEDEPPMTGGTLNATAEQAREDRIRADHADHHRPILSHDKPAASQAEEPEEREAPEAPRVEQPELIAAPVVETPVAKEEHFPDLDFEESPLPIDPSPPIDPTPVFNDAPVVDSTETVVHHDPNDPPTLSEIEEKVKDLKSGETTELNDDDLNRAREAVQDVIAKASFDPANEPLQSLNTLPLGEPLHQHDLPPPPPPPTSDFASLPPLPPLPPAPTTDDSGVVAPPSPFAPATPPAAPAEPAPGQFRIPGQ